MPGSPLYAPRISSCRALKVTNDGTMGSLTRKTIHEIGRLTIYQPQQPLPPPSVEENSSPPSTAPTTSSESTTTQSSSLVHHPPTSGIIQTYSPHDKISSLT